MTTFTESCFDNRFRRAAFCSMAAMSLGLGIPAGAQGVEERPRATALEEVVVTARRREENLQDVPISITVFDQQQLSNRNIVNAADLATFTPGLTVNTRFGDDSSAFAIRGFTQELRTTASVGVYFADVVAPRGNGAVTAGDGAGPGAYFDLANVQVLKGPQGTLFGRNTTGGAVLIVPQKPTDTFEGYLEGSIGNYDMWRGQGVVNIPLTDRARLRLGIDRQQRDGYLKNVSGIGPRRLADVDYVSARASLVLDLTPTLENYTILTYADSENDGSVTQVFDCNPAGGGLSPIFGPLCAAQLSRQSGGFYEVANAVPDSKSLIEQWQAINTTTWQVSERLTVKNILSYAQLETTLRTGVFGTHLFMPTFTGPAATGSLPFYFASSAQVGGMPTTSQRSFVEEFQLQGEALGQRLNWQAGLYYETSKPHDDTGGLSFGNISCDISTMVSDPAAFRCNDVLASIVGLPLGSALISVGDVEFENKAVYAQGSYDLSDALSLTAGIRYTWDETRGDTRQMLYRFPSSNTTGAGWFPPLSVPGYSPICANPGASLPDCHIKLKQKSDEPTWLLGVDYKPSDTVMLYAKYARGYRQGAVNIVGVAGLDTHGPEQVDTYELGAKTRFAGPLPGFFNVSLFYNDFQDQQIQLGLLPVTAAPTTAIVNAGASTIQGVEVEAGVELFRDFNLNLSYTYLDTEMERIDVPSIPPGLLFAPPSLTAEEGDPLSYSPRHQLAATAAWRLPLPAAAGDLVFAATYIYTDEQQATAASVTPYATIPSYELLNLNLNWNGIGGSPVDASLFATNALKEEYYTFVSGQYDSTGFEARALGQPRMVGVRLRYNF